VGFAFSQRKPFYYACVELFYNIEVTPWFHLTPDLQIIDSGFGGIPDLGLQEPDTAVVVGLRGKIDF
jgi:porin